MPTLILASVLAVGVCEMTLPTSDALSVCVVPTLPTLNPAAVMEVVASACVRPTTAGTTPVRFR